jgi:methionyl aminopeptidase
MSKNKHYIIHTEEEIKKIRVAAAAAGLVRTQLPKMVTIGMSTKQVDQLAGQLIAATGGKSAFLGYRGFPGQICISINDEVVHGIGREDVILQENDLISVDIGVKLDGGIGDNATSFFLGKIDNDIARLLKYTEKALHNAIAKAVKGNFINDISNAIERTAKQGGLGIVREYVGHGCGIALHEPPEVPNFTSGFRGPQLRPGMVLAIEPMFNIGTYKVKTDKDKWTVRTRDGKKSAHFEHMVLITDNKPEVLTWQKM